jgi:hypothetical protein
MLVTDGTKTQLRYGDSVRGRLLLYGGRELLVMSAEGRNAVVGCYTRRTRVLSEYRTVTYRCVT